MAATLKTYDIVCPYCDHESQVERDPAELAKGDGDLIECPNCSDEFEWDYDPEADTLELTPFDDDDSEDFEELPGDSPFDSDESEDFEELPGDSPF